MHINVYAQPWLYNNASVKSTSELNFIQQRSLFNSYWSDKDFRKGKGYKQFRRWEQFLSPRIGTGSDIDANAYWEALSSLVDSAGTDTLNWELAGPSATPLIINSELKAGSGRINCIAFHPSNEDYIYAGAPSGGLWISEDDGESWNTTTDQLNSIGVSDIVVIEKDTSTTIYLATGDGDAGDTYAIGIIKSEDGGLNWVTTGLSLNAANTNYFRRMVSLSDKGNTMIATSNKGIYRTTDGWESYSLIKTGNFKDLEVHPGDTNIIYATSYNSSGNAAIYVSDNAGKTFSISNTGLDISGEVNRIELAVTPDYEDLVYALCCSAESSGFYALYRSTDKGQTWNLLYDDSRINLLGRYPTGTDYGGQGHYDLALTASPDNYKDILVGGVNLWRSTNGGTKWSLSSYMYHTDSYEYVHADHHMLTYSPHTKDVYSANDGGVYRSSDNGSAWTDITANLEILQVYKIGSSVATENYFICGNQDNGTILRNQNNWNMIISGDGMFCHVDKDNDSILFASAYNGMLFRSTTRGTDFANISPSDDLSGAWITPFIPHPQNASTLYAGYYNVYKSTDRGDSWTMISEDLSDELLQHIAVAPSNDDYIYAATYTKLFKTENGGSNWKEISTGFTDLSITSLNISPNDPNKLWVSLSGYNELDKIYYTKTGGDSWLNYSDGLPNVPVNKVIMRYNSNNELYAATDIGVYYRNADSSKWTNISSRLPNVIVSDIEIIEPQNILRAATYGRGVWQTTIPDAIASKANFSANITTGCVDAPITIYYKDTVSYDSLIWSISDGEILDYTINNDTLTISFPTKGKKTISLTHYSDSSKITEIKYNYLTISDTLELSLEKDSYFACDTSPLTITLKNGYSYNWTPSDYLDTTSGNTVVVKPLSSITYTVSIIHGKCVTTDELSIQYMPDSIKNAQIIEVEVEDTFSNECAGIEEYEPVPPVGTGENGGCISQDGWCQEKDTINNTLWFKFSPVDSTRLMVRVNGMDSQIALYMASSAEDIINGNYTLLAANDDRSLVYGGSLIDIDSGFQIGDTLWLQVDVAEGSDPGEFRLLVSADSARIYSKVIIEDSFKASIYPNPADQMVYVKIPSLYNTGIRIDILNLSGQRVFSQEYYNQSGNSFNTEISTTSMEGLYLVRITTNNSVYTKKLIVRR